LFPRDDPPPAIAVSGVSQAVILFAESYRISGCSMRSARKKFVVQASRLLGTRHRRDARTTNQDIIPILHRLTRICYELARKHGLVVYDPQQGKIFYPGV
jgi:hypothetical protein